MNAVHLESARQKVEGFDRTLADILRLALTDYVQPVHNRLDSFILGVVLLDQSGVRSFVGGLAFAIGAKFCDGGGGHLGRGFLAFGFDASSLPMFVSDFQLNLQWPRRE